MELVAADPARFPHRGRAVPTARASLSRHRATRVEGRLAGRTVLEVGCGAGRFTEAVLAPGALVTRVDLVDRQRKCLTCPPDDRHRLAQADIRHLPFGGQGFDVVLGLRVVQDTPGPKETMPWIRVHNARRLVKRLPRRGQLPTVYAWSMP
jgi:2-polyprenyl-3-methyl-5-hydroxy-6-metoxy-1,4-benzoquinol methylase